nr:ATP-binding protein [Desulforamulus aquiferis]
MIEELDRANSIISEFLSMGSNKISEFTIGNLNTIVNAIVPLIQADALSQNKYLLLEINEIANLLLNPNEIRQLILNLCRNGLEAMEEGNYLTIKTYQEANRVVLAVTDQGSGIKPEVLEKIGTPFLSTKDNGTGLGLGVCYGIANRHNAKIDIQTGSKGTTFFVKFIMEN